MQRVTIGRYQHESVKQEYAGWIEGTRDDGTDWVLFLDKDANPTVYWPRRAEDGGVEGEPVPLP